MRPIDAEALMQKLSRMIDYWKKDTKVNAITALFQVGDAIMDCPTIEAKPVVHAHWKKWGCEGTVCSNCYGRVLYECDEQEKKSKFCPHCGAQMDEEVSE